MSPIGSIVVNEIVMPLESITIREGKLFFVGVLGPGKPGRYEVGGECRLHGSDGIALITTRGLTYTGPREFVLGGSDSLALTWTMALVPTGDA